MAQNEYQEYLDFTMTLAKQAGALIKEAFYKEKSITFKDATDMVTETDKQVEAFVIQKIKQKYPSHVFIAEEGAAAGDFDEVLTEKPTWIIDPIDGTTNFVSRFPFVCISIGFAIGKEIVVGVVFNPIMDELFSASKGHGAFRNGIALHVSKCENMKHAVVATGFPYERSDEVLDAVLGRLKTVLKACRAVRRAGSAALDMCYVAAGILDLYFEKGVHAWDIAAGVLLVTESGGVVMSVDGSPFDVCQRQICVTNKQLADQIKPLIK